MKSKLKILVLILLGLLLISGCVESKKDFAYSELLSGKEGKYSLLVVIDQPEGKTLVEFPEVANAELHFNEYYLSKLIKMTDLKSAQNSYTLLEISKAPSFLVFDNKGLVLKTNNEEAVKSFFNNNESALNVNSPLLDEGSLYQDEKLVRDNRKNYKGEIPRSIDSIKNSK